MSRMKLIIQIPCYNEEKTLPLVIKDLPKKIPGVKKIEIQVINDGSTDKTEKVARKLKVKHIVSFKQNLGLAQAFMVGVNNALAQGADILVNTDGDNQYQGRDTAKLVKPIVKGQADLVIGCRSIDEHPDFSQEKKWLQKVGSKVMRLISKTNVADAASGFRAYSREAMLQLNVFSDFSYCMETLLQAGYKQMKVVGVDIRVNKKTRESRLYKTMLHYLWRSGNTIVDIFFLYWSKIFFSLLSMVFFVVAVLLVVRFLYRILFLGSVAGTFWPTVVLAGVLLIASIQIYLTGVLASMVSSNRKLSEEILYRMKREEYGVKSRKKR